MSVTFRESIPESFSVAVFNGFGQGKAFFSERVDDLAEELFVGFQPRSEASGVFLLRFEPPLRYVGKS